ncbi:MAG: type II secretion system protein J [Bacteriovoracaceae bacterium]
MKKMIKESGFSLVQVMVAGGLVAGLGVVVMQLQNNMLNVTKSSEANAEVVELNSELQRTFENSMHCQATFEAKPLDATSRDLDQIVRVRKDGTKMPWYRNGEEFPSRYLKIESMTYQETGDEFLKVDVSILKTNKILKGKNNTVKKSYLLEFTKGTDGKIVSCGGVIPPELKKGMIIAGCYIGDTVKCWGGMTATIQMAWLCGNSCTLYPVIKCPENSELVENPKCIHTSYDGGGGSTACIPDVIYCLGK